MGHYGERNSYSNHRMQQIDAGIEGLDGDRILTCRQVANIAGVHPITVQGWIRSGRLRAYKIGTGVIMPWRIRLSHLYLAFPEIRKMVEDPPPPEHVSEYELDGEYHLDKSGITVAEPRNDETVSDAPKEWTSAEFEEELG